MSITSNRNAINEYKQASPIDIEEFTPHRLIQMLMEGVLEKLATAIGMMEHGNIAGKGENIGKAISIIDGLRVSLDKKAGGEIASNLDLLYEYMGKRLLEANVLNKSEYLTEVVGLINNIKGAWDQIPQDIISDHAKKSKLLDN